MKYQMVPVINIDDLEEALKIQYGPDFIDWDDNFRSILFDDIEYNEVVKMFNITEMIEWSHLSYVDERDARIINCTKTLLKDTFPETEYVLINILW